MKTGKDAEQLLRKYEGDVLDIYHKKYSLWQIDKPTAQYAALAQNDAYAIVELLAPPGRPEMGSVQILKRLEEGLGQGFRWLHDGSAQADVAPTANAKIIQDAGSFCQFAGKYVDIADFHKMFGRKQLDLEVNEQQKRVKFTFKKQGHASVLGYVEAAHRLGRSPLFTASAELVKLSRSLCQHLTRISIHLDSGRIVFDSMEAVNDPIVREMMGLVSPSEELLIPEETDLLGFTVKEFERYFDGLRRWSFCATFLFVSAATSGKDQATCMPTQVVPREQFIVNMGVLTGLAAPTIEAITLRLTYDNRTVSPDLYQQPLVCGPHTVAWSVRLIERSRHLRNLLKLMARTPAQADDAATIIGSRDRAMLNELGGLLAKRGGSAYKVMVPIAGAGEAGDVDLLAFNWKFPDEVLVVEGKALLGVDEINEVESATKEMLKAQTQLEKVFKILSALTPEQKKQLFKFVSWEHPKTLFGVVVAQDAEPNDKYDHSNYPGISLATIRDRLSDRCFASPQALWTTCKNRPWMKALDQATETYAEVYVGDVTYLLPALEVPRAEAPQPAKKPRRRR